MDIFLGILMYFKAIGKKERRVSYYSDIFVKHYAV